MELEKTYSAHNYHSLPVVFSRAKGVLVWDENGKEYLDFLSAYSAVSQGHCHPKILQALLNQAERCTLSSRAFYNDKLGVYAKFITEYFNYEMVLPMNTGAEAVETALKICRKWGYMKKKIPKNKAIIFAVSGNFHGRTLGVISMSTDPEAKEFGPLCPRLGPLCPQNHFIPYNDLKALEKAFEKHGAECAGVLVEPIQGEAGVIVPDDGYLRGIKKLCEQYNALMICDEIQTGIGRTGKLLAYLWDGDDWKPDLVCLGKALSGGVYPVSAVLGSREVILCIKEGEHGSTFGGNPLACAVAIAALEVVRDENLTEKALNLGSKLKKLLVNLNSKLIKEVRGRGLLNAIEMVDTLDCWDFCVKLCEFGLLAKPTHGNIIRLAPPLCITEAEIEKAVGIIKKTLNLY